MNFEWIAPLFVGVLFGFLLQKAGVTQFSTIVGQLILKNFTVMKVIMTAIAVGSMGLYSLKIIFPDASTIISSTTLFAAAIGGGVFGMGMAILGYCPGTCVGALGEKARDAFFGVLGMIFGAGIYAEAYSWIVENIKPHEAINQSTLAEHFSLTPWFFVALSFLVVLILVAMDRTKSKSKVKGLS